jgi:hypothetical protein
MLQGNHLDMILAGMPSLWQLGGTRRPRQRAHLLYAHRDSLPCTAQAHSHHAAPSPECLAMPHLIHAAVAAATILVFAATVLCLVGAKYHLWVPMMSTLNASGAMLLMMDDWYTSCASIHHHTALGSRMMRSCDWALHHAQPMISTDMPLIQCRAWLAAP